MEDQVYEESSIGKNNEDYQNKQQDEEIFENDWNQQEQNTGDRFTDFMFGPRKLSQQNTGQQQSYQQNGVYIDYMLLMNSLDTLMESTKNLKPLIHRFYPFIEKFLKKK